jgi:hypothetical protein
MKASAKLLCVVAIASLGACAAGPKQLQRSVDDWDRDLYVREPLLNGVLHVVPVIPLANFVAAIGDFFITNPYHFWLEDVMDGEGTNYEHANVADQDGSVESLMNDGAKFVKKQ